MYRKGCDGIKANTKNVGVDRDFYGSTPETSVDDQLTESEIEFSQMVDELRVPTRVGRLDDPRIPGLIAHFSTRTRSLRHSVSDSMDFLLDRLRSCLEKKETLHEMLGGQVVREQIAREIRSWEFARELTAQQLEQLVCLVQPILPRLVEEKIPNFSEFVDGFIRLAKSKTSQVVHDSHIKAMAQNPTLPQRAALYSAVHWFILESRDPLILGDTVCIFETSGVGRPFKPLDEKDDVVSRIYLPISWNLVLIGTPYRAQPKLDSRRLNKALAKCSYEFFISSRELRRDSSLPPSIGKWSGILTKDELDEIGNRINLS